MELYDKVYGALLSAAVGDAMGAATEARTTAQIVKVFGHRVETFEKPPADAIGAGNEAGQLTDDFSCAYFLSKHIIAHKGLITREIVEQAIVDWSEHDVFYTRFAACKKPLTFPRRCDILFAELLKIQQVNRRAI